MPQWLCGMMAGAVALGCHAAEPHSPPSQTDPGIRHVDPAAAKLLIEGNCLHCHVDRVLTLVAPSNNGLDVRSADPGQGGGAFRAASLRNIAAAPEIVAEIEFLPVLSASGLARRDLAGQAEAAIRAALAADGRDSQPGTGASLQAGSH